jgi:uncharacterized protein YecE (DUF72 family)
LNEKGPATDEKSSAINNISIGTSGWSYKEWEKIFYPDSKVPKLTYYSGIFGTAEIDSTFYAYPTRGLVLGWARNTPPNFEFAAKLPQTITHDKRLDLSKGAEVDLVRFLDLMAPLKESSKLGPLLIQLPPSFDRNEFEKLKEFLGSLPRDYRFAIEFRHKSWLEDRTETYSLLEKYEIANTIVDEPLMPVDLSTTSKSFAFIRWHGRGKRVWYNYQYSEQELEPWVERVKQVSQKVRKVYGYFNNHFHASAVENSLFFLESMGLASQKQEQTLEDIRKRRKEPPAETEEQETDALDKAQMKLG